MFSSFIKDIKDEEKRGGLMFVYDDGSDVRKTDEAQKNIRTEVRWTSSFASFLCFTRFTYSLLYIDKPVLAGVCSLALPW